MVKLVKLPPGIKLLGLERKTRNIRKDYTGFTKSGSKIIGFAGVRSKNSVWLCKCKCGSFRLVPSGFIERMNVCKKCDIKKRNWGGLVNIYRLEVHPVERVKHRVLNLGGKVI